MGFFTKENNDKSNIDKMEISFKLYRIYLQLATNQSVIVSQRFLQDHASKRIIEKLY